MRFSNFHITVLAAILTAACSLALSGCGAKTEGAAQTQPGTGSQ